MREVWILGRIDLLRGEDKDGSDWTIIEQLFDEGCVVNESKISVEQEQVHEKLITRNQNFFLNNQTEKNEPKIFSIMRYKVDCYTWP